MKKFLFSLSFLLLLFTLVRSQTISIGPILGLRAMSPQIDSDNNTNINGSSVPPNFSVEQILAVRGGLRLYKEFGNQVFFDIDGVVLYDQRKLTLNSIQYAVPFLQYSYSVKLGKKVSRLLISVGLEGYAESDGHRDSKGWQDLVSAFETIVGQGSTRSQIRVKGVTPVLSLGYDLGKLDLIANYVPAVNELGSYSFEFNGDQYYRPDMNMQSISLLLAYKFGL